MTKDSLDTTGLNPVLFQGFSDPVADVAFFNNSGWLSSRRFELGSLGRLDFETAIKRHSTTIFGIEDCQLRYASRAPSGPDISTVVLLRDPLNNIASRLEGAKSRPEVFRTDEAYIDMYAGYCEEFLGRSNVFDRKVLINFNRFVDDRAYRDSTAAALGLENLDVVDEATDFGGSSSFTPGTGPSPTSALMTRFREHPIPEHLIEMLLERPVIHEACSTLFGYELIEQLSA